MESPIQLLPRENKETTKKTLHKKTKPAEKITVLVSLCTVTRLTRNLVLNDPSASKDDIVQNNPPKEINRITKERSSVDFRAPKTPPNLQASRNGNDSLAPLCQINLMHERPLNSVTSEDLNHTITPNSEKNFKFFFMAILIKESLVHYFFFRMAQRWTRISLL